MAEVDGGDDFHQRLEGLHGRVEKLEDLNDSHFLPRLGRLETDMDEMRNDLRLLGVKIDGSASKQDVIDIMRKIDEGNSNLATALATPSQSQANASFWIASLGSIAMVVASIAGIYAIFIHH